MYRLFKLKNLKEFFYLTYWRDCLCSALDNFTNNGSISISIELTRRIQLLHKCSYRGAAILKPLNYNMIGVLYMIKIKIIKMYN